MTLLALNNWALVIFNIFKCASRMSPYYLLNQFYLNTYDLYDICMSYVIFPNAVTHIQHVKVYVVWSIECFHLVPTNEKDNFLKNDREGRKPITDANYVVVSCKSIYNIFSFFYSFYTWWD